MSRRRWTVVREQRANDRDLGVRPGVARALGLEGRSEVSKVDHDTTLCDVFGCPKCIEIANAVAS